MQHPETIEAVVQDCRFVLSTADAQSLLAPALPAIPPMARVELLDSPREASVLGYPVRHAPDVLGDLVRLVLGQLGRALAEPDRVDPVDSLTAAQLREDPWCRRLTSLLVRCAAHGERARLDSVLWLVIADVVAGLVNHHEPTLELVRRLLPDEARKGERYVQELLRQKGSSTTRHATTKNRVLRAVFARCDFAMSSVSEVLGEAYSNVLWREMVANRLVFSEKPGGLHSFFDLREVFAVRAWRIDAEEFGDVQRLVRAVVEEAYRHAGAAKASSAESWLLGRFATDAVLEKAGRLDVADATSSVSHEGEDFPSRVAWLLSLQPEPVDYILSHLDALGASKLVAKREDLGKEFRASLKTPSALAPLVPGYQEVQRAVLSWDFLSALRGRLLAVEEDGGGRMTSAGRAVRSGARPLDLASPDRIRDPERHATVVSVDLGEFSKKVASQILGAEDRSAPDPDFAALCLRQLMSIRNNLGVFRGRAESFAGGVLTDVFPRALDALRYVTLFQAAVERTRLLRRAPWAEARANPFAVGLRAGLATGRIADLALPGRADDEGVASRWYAAGPLLDAAAELASSRGGSGGPSVSASQLIQAQLSGVHDPLQVVRVHAASGRLDNRGLCSFGQTFREIAAAVRIEGLPTWTPEGRGDLIAGRRVVLKNYRFEMIFDDPATGRIVLVRQVEGASLSPSAAAGGEGLYEYVVLWPDAFQTFIDRVMELERHQPVMANRPSREVRRPVDSRPVAGDSRPVPDAEADPGKAALAALGGADQLGADADLGALNLPDAADFRFSAQQTSDDLEARLGLALGHDGLGAFGAAGDLSNDDLGWDLSGPLALPDLEGESLVPGDHTPPDLGLLDGLGAPPTPPKAHPAIHSAYDPVEASGEVLARLGGGAAAPRLALDETAPGFGLSTEELLPLEGVGGASSRRVTGSHAPVGSAPSLLGALDNAFIDRILAVEGRPPRRPPPTREAVASQVSAPAPDAPPPAPAVRRDSEASVPALQRAWGPKPPPIGPAPERLSVPRPDFHVLFRDYVTFWVGEEGKDGSWIAIGRRYRDVFFDLQRFDTPLDRPGFAIDDALEAFLRGKIRENFVPQSLSYEELPPGAGPRTAVDVAQLERAFAAIT